MLPGAPTGEELKKHIGPPHVMLLPREVRAEEYLDLRREADAWHARRTEYMMTRLQAGRHPDMDPSFWNEYADPGAPRLSGSGRNELLALIGSGIVLGIYLLRRLWKQYGSIIRSGIGPPPTPPR
jgi:hypothetical protein